MLITIIINPKNTHGLKMIVNTELSTAAGVKSNRSKLVMPFFSMIWERKFVPTVNSMSGIKRVMGLGLQ